MWLCWLWMEAWSIHCHLTWWRKWGKFADVQRTGVCIKRNILFHYSYLNAMTFNGLLSNVTVYHCQIYISCCISEQVFIISVNHPHYVTINVGKGCCHEHIRYIHTRISARDSESRWWNIYFQSILMSSTAHWTSSDP